MLLDKLEWTGHDDLPFQLKDGGGPLSRWLGQGLKLCCSCWKRAWTLPISSMNVCCSACVSMSNHSLSEACRRTSNSFMMRVPVSVISTSSAPIGGVRHASNVV